MSKIRVAVGPELPAFGSWNWLGVGLAKELNEKFDVYTFRDNPPEADIVLYLKFKPDIDSLQKLKGRHKRLVFMPVDIYGSVKEIDEDRLALGLFDLVIVHSRRLVRYFTSATRVEYLDHPLKYILPVPRSEYQPGPLLWVGRSCNIAPVVEWANRSKPTEQVMILTNTEDSAHARDFGFSSELNVHVENWSSSTHVEWLQRASMAIDIKGNDFRSRHKPPAKAFDYLASGIPVLTNRGSSVALEMHHRGLTPLFESQYCKAVESINRSYIVGCCDAVRQTSDPRMIWRRQQEMLLELVL